MNFKELENDIKNRNKFDDNLLYDYFMNLLNKIDYQLEKIKMLSNNFKNIIDSVPHNCIQIPEVAFYKDGTHKLHKIAVLNQKHYSIYE